MNLQSMSREQLEALVAKMTAAKTSRLSCKVTAPKADGTGSSGAISISGFGRFPVTLYASQWEALIAFIKAGTLEDFIETNEAILARK